MAILLLLTTALSSVAASRLPGAQLSRVASSAVRMNVWELRVAGGVDVDQLAKMSKLPNGVVQQFVNTGASCVAADIDGKVLAFTLVNTFKRVKDKSAGAGGGLETTGEIMSCRASAQGKQYLKQTTMGAMKLLKGMSASEVRSSVDSSDAETMQHLLSLGLTEAGSAGGFATLKGALFALNTDPGKKIDAAPVVRKAKVVVVEEAPAEAAEEPAAAADEPADEPAAAAEEPVTA